MAFHKFVFERRAPPQTCLPKDMKQINTTSVMYFIIKGISDTADLQAPIFLLFLLIYLITLGGNMTILQLICIDNQLHTPMYFFLGNLSVLDMFSITITLHNILNNFNSGVRTESLFACMAQVYLFISLSCDELLMLTAMSYDRYVAICNPLHYPMVMNRNTCLILAIFSWLVGFIECIPHLVLLLGISCYRSNIINHFYCDLVPVMTVSCSDTSALKTLMVTEGAVFSLTLFILTFSSYFFIIKTLIRIRSSTRRRKAFYTCSSHLTVVILLYATLFFQYMRPNSSDSLDSNKLFSLFNVAAVPILNPLIYSLKNKDVKSALRRQLAYLGCF
ncbi:olfactory receptor 6C1-like [Discoglossus pictus]